MLMSYLSQARPSDLLLFLQACKAFLCQHHECLRRVAGGSWWDILVLAESGLRLAWRVLRSMINVWLFRWPLTIVAWWSNRVGMLIVCTPQVTLFLFLVKRRKFFLFASWLCPPGMKMSNAGIAPCTWSLPPSRITWATVSRSGQAGTGWLNGSWGSVYGWRLKPTLDQKQVLKCCHNFGICCVPPCRFGCWHQMLGTFIPKYYPSVYSLPSSSLGRTEMNQRVFSDNLHYSLNNFGPRPCELCSWPLQSERMCTTATFPVVLWTLMWSEFCRIRPLACWVLHRPRSKGMFLLNRGWLSMGAGLCDCPGTSQPAFSMLSLFCVPCLC